jgi:hypothetical protein
MGAHGTGRGEACEALFLGRCALGPQFFAGFATAEIALPGPEGRCAVEQARMDGVATGVDGKRKSGRHRFGSVVEMDWLGEQDRKLENCGFRRF